MTDIPNQVKWFKVFQNLATDLKAEVALAALSEIIVKQSTATNLEALVTLKGLQGIIPNPITATRVIETATDQENKTAVLYTVPSGKKLYIDYFWFAVGNTAVSDFRNNLHIRDGSDVIWKYLAYAYVVSKNNIALSGSRYPAIEVPAGYDVCLVSGGAGCNASCGIDGWLENV